jgi:hypothetical protein
MHPSQLPRSSCSGGQESNCYEVLKIPMYGFFAATRENPAVAGMTVYAIAAGGVTSHGERVHSEPAADELECSGVL